MMQLLEELRHLPEPARDGAAFLPVAGVTGMVVCGVSLNDWFLLLSIFYTLLLIAHFTWTRIGLRDWLKGLRGK